MPGFVPVATLPVATAPVSAPAASALWDIPDGREACLLVIARPYDLAARSAAGDAPVATLPVGTMAAAGGPVDPPVYLSTHDWRTEPDDATLPGVAFAARLAAPGLNFSTSIPTPEGSARGQGDVGALALLNPDGALDAYLTDKAWSGRPVEVYAGLFDRRTLDGVRVHNAFSTFRLVLRARAAAEPDATRGGVTLRLKSSAEVLDRPLQKNLYAGSGDYEGGAELAGRPKPLLWGRRRQIEPVLVDAARLIYQVHDGSVSAIDAVRDQGVALAADGDAADLLAWTPVPGRYATDLARGLFRLGGSPTGAVTCDAEGDNAGGYVERAAEIARRIAVRAGVSDVDGVDGPSFWAATVANQATVGYFTRDPVTAAEALDAVLGTIGARWSFGRDDRLRVTLLAEPAASALWSFDERHVVEAEVLAPEQPLWRVRVGWRPYARTLAPAEIAGAVSDTDRDAFGRASRFAEGVFGAALSVHPLAEEAEVPALFDLEADALAEAARRVALRRSPKMILRLRLAARSFKPFQMSLGDTVSVALPRWGLSAGSRFVLVGLAEEGLGATLTLWGPRPAAAAAAEECPSWLLDLGFGCAGDPEPWTLAEAA